jgi:hypothetical protein
MRHDLVEAGYEFWEEQHDHAIAIGRGEAVALEEERIAAADELAAATFEVLIRIGCRLPAADQDAALAREAAAVVRLLDRALAAHGRDNGYDVGAWRMSAVTCAWSLGDEECAGATWLATAIEDATRDIAQALLAIPRDRLGVPECLASALGHALVVYARLSGPLP